MITERHSRWEIFPSGDRVRDCEVDGIARTPERDDVTEPEKDHGQRVCPFGTLRSITKRTDDNHEKQSDVELDDVREAISK